MNQTPSEFKNTVRPSPGVSCWDEIGEETTEVCRGKIDEERVGKQMRGMEASHALAREVSSPRDCPSRFFFCSVRH